MKEIGITLLSLCLMAMIAALPDCTENDLHFEFTECDSDKGRWRVSVPKKDKTCVVKNPKPPVRGQSCDFTCQSGQYLDMETQQCKKCSAGTYSLGGGERFEEWEKIPEGFSVDTESFASYDDHEEDAGSFSCNKSAWTANGHYISASPKRCSSTLVYSVNLVKAGYVQFEYQYPSSTSSFFSFVARNSECEAFGDRSGSRWPDPTEEGKWKMKKVLLKSGLNVLNWKALEYVSGSRDSSSTADKPILIRKIEIEGVAFTSTCTKCRNGTFSTEGASSCKMCSANTHALKGQAQCTPCDPTSEYSGMGAATCLKKPACTKQDYYEFQDTCKLVNGKKKTQKLYKWIEPKICRNDLSGAVNLPAPGKLEDCPPCNPGMQYINGGCEFCPDNMYSDGAKPCAACPPSTSPDIGLEYKWWNEMPTNMSGTCITFSEDECTSNSSWVLSGDHIRTQYGRDQESYLVLILKIDGFRGEDSLSKDIEVGTVTFQFETKCKGPCEFIFLTDETGRSSIVKTWISTQDKQEFNHNIHSNQPLTLTWAFESSELLESNKQRDVAKIYSIRVTNTLHGGATSCQNCPKQSDVKKGCIPCPMGHYIDTNTTNCEMCPQNSIVKTRFAWGIDSCVKCGPGLRAKKGSCLPDCVYKDESGREYDFTPLKSVHYLAGSSQFTGSGTQFYHGFNISLCPDEKTMATCTNNVTDLTKQTETVTSMICRSTMVPSSKSHIMASTQPVSIGNYMTKIISNQSHDSEIHKHYVKEGIPVEDMERDVHFFYKSDAKTQACPHGRATIISLKCDPDEDGEGTLELPPKCADGTCDGCSFHFLWKTKQACPKCLEADLDIIVGECLDGEQTVHYSTPKFCMPQKNMKKTEQRKCQLKLAALPYTLKIAVPSILGVGVVLIICLIYCWLRNRKLEYKYMKLVEGSGNDGELPGVDSCALEDGEDEQFDSVSFSKSKGKGLFSKLRGKKNKMDDNPFELSNTEKIPLT